MNRNEIKVIVKSPATTFAHPSGLAVGLCALAVVLIMFTLASPAVWAQGLPLRTCPNGASAYLCQGDIVIADPSAGRNSPGGSTGEGALFLINAATGAQTLISQGSLLTESVGVVVESNGMLVVADRVNGIIRVDPSTGGQTLLPTGAGPSNDFFGIARDANGNFIVADSGLNFDKGVNLPAGRILRIDKTTGAQTVIAPAQGVANNIIHPYGVAIDPLDTSILVSDMSSFGTGAIIRIDPVTLNQHVVWGPTSAFPDVVQSAPFNCPMGITVEASRDILATVFSHSGYGCSNPGIFRVDLMNLFGGGQVTVSANPPVGWALPFGITTEASKNILVVDEILQGIYRLNPAGTFIGPTPLTGKDQPATLNFLVNPVGIVSLKFQPTVNISNVAPVITSVIGPVAPVPLGSGVTITANFTDANASDTHTCSLSWGDGIVGPGVVTDSSGSGACTQSHTYTLPGVYMVAATVTDNGGLSAASSFQFVIIFDTSDGFVTGGGWINSSAGAYSADLNMTGKATFGFESKYIKGQSTPSGKTEFNFQVAKFIFKSTSYDWLVVAGAKAQFKGSGTVNGSGDYGFILTATDSAVNGGGTVDKFRIKIWNKATGIVVYDNGRGAGDNSDPPTALGGGNITIHG